MPGNVQNAAPATVLPAFLSSAFESSRLWTVEENEYQNGERQTRALTTTPRRRWRLQPHVTGTQLAALRTFIMARRFIEPFYFYDGTETSPYWQVDPSGSSPTGRYVVVARGGYEQAIGIARCSMSLELEELA